ncbi:MAG: hydroxymethylbilane synthase [Candidatus Omnitrophica bacterium]|nr:hydroxymethylbilane synthase [Candidatus Omnitrophota bacterium]
MKKKIVIGSRGSRLALYESEAVKRALLEHFPHLEIEIRIIKTEGDSRLDLPLPAFGGKGAFTKEIEEALLKKEIDLAVHSIKDLPTTLPDGLELIAVLEREDPRDCFISKDGKKLMDLRAGAKIGTSSIRRIAQLKRLRADLEPVNVRGNVETRLRKLNEGEYDGMVMAYAGLKRLGLDQHVSQILDIDFFVPACGQGIIGIEARENDQDLVELCAAINDPETELRGDAERMFLAFLEGGCQVPCGVLSEIKGSQIVIRAVVLAPDGSEEIRSMKQGPSEDALELARHLADDVIRRGAKRLIGD